MYSVHHFLEGITKDKKFSDFVINKRKEIEADVRSFRADPNCSCKNRLKKFYESNKSLCDLDMDLYSENNGINFNDFVKIEQEINNNYKNLLKTNLPPNEWHKYKDVIGEIVEISPDPNEYKRIMTIAREEWLYNGLNILETVKLDPQTSEEKVVWLLLFY